MSTPRPDRPASPLADRVAAELQRQIDQHLEPGLYLVATPIGNLGDISLRAIAVLARADLICCEDSRHSRILLDHFDIRRPLGSYHEHNAEAERPRVLAAIAAGQVVALVSDAGTPLVSDPGYKLVRAALEAGLRVISIPGASAVLAGLTSAGLPTDCFLFAGFLPPREKGRRERLVELADAPATLVLFEAPTRLESALVDIAAVLPDRDVAVARELTKRFEQIKRGKAEELAAWAGAPGGLKGEIVILVAPPRHPPAASDSDISAQLASVMPDMSLRDAARAVADRLGVAKSRVYAIGLKMKGPAR